MENRLFAATTKVEEGIPKARVQGIRGQVSFPIPISEYNRIAPMNLLLVSVEWIDGEWVITNHQKIDDPKLNEQGYYLLSWQVLVEEIGDGRGPGKKLVQQPTYTPGEGFLYQVDYGEGERNLEELIASPSGTYFAV